MEIEGGGVCISGDPRFVYVESCRVLYAAAVCRLICSLSPYPDRGFFICTVIPYHNAAFAARAFWLKEYSGMLSK
jgi:hypothetical protein